MATKLKVNEIQNHLRAKYFGRFILFSHEVDSTNRLAEELAIYGAHEGTVVISEVQTKGRGRLHRKWISPTGGLWFSLILRPALQLKEVPKLAFVAGLAVAEILCELYDLDVKTKWLNDVLVNERKICGILVRTNTTIREVNFVVIGLGINANFDVKEVFPVKLASTATSLENELGRKVQLEKLFIALLERLENLYDLFTNEGFDPILQKWKKHAGFLGRRIEVKDAAKRIDGVALDVDNEGALVIRLNDGTLKRTLVGDIFV